MAAVAACAPKAAEPSAIAVGSVSAPTTASPPPDARSTNGFPGGPGVTLVADQLQEAARDPKVRDSALSYEVRLAEARAYLGVEGEPEKDMLVDGVSFVGVGTRLGMIYSCEELVVSKHAPQWAIRQTDNKRCGLPYNDEAHPGPNGLRLSVAKLRANAALVAGLTPAAAEQRARLPLGPPQRNPSGGKAIWYGVGPRGRDAPITCWSLVLDPQPTVAEAPLSACGYAWPPPAAAFDPGPNYPPISRAAGVAECAKTCNAQQICVLDERTPFPAHLVTDAEGNSIAHYDDGKHAKAETSASCAPIPAGCTPLTSACFFGGLPPPPPGPHAPPAAVIPPNLPREGPCPKDTFSGFAFQTIAGSPTIVCHSAIRRSSSAP